MRSKRRLACEREIKSFGLCSAIFTGTTVLLNAWSFSGDAYASKTSLRDLSDVFFNFIQTAVPFVFFKGDTDVKYTPPDSGPQRSTPRRHCRRRHRRRHFHRHLRRVFPLLSFLLFFLRQQ